MTLCFSILQVSGNHVSGTMPFTSILKLTSAFTETGLINHSSRGQLQHWFVVKTSSEWPSSQDFGKPFFALLHLYC